MRPRRARRIARLYGGAGLCGFSALDRNTDNDFFFGTQATRKILPSLNLLFWRLPPLLGGHPIKFVELASVFFQKCYAVGFNDLLWHELEGRNRREYSEKKVRDIVQPAYR
jgi:hypothetical protein